VEVHIPLIQNPFCWKWLFPLRIPVRCMATRY